MVKERKKTRSKKAKSTRQTGELGDGINLKGKALRKAVKSKDQYRLEGVPLIQDETVLITPKKAEEILEKNPTNRPVNWNKVRQFEKEMKLGKWKFHAQGIIIDSNGNLLTGQKRLWAVIRCGIPQYFRISKGSPPETAPYIDRGAPQSSRDLASRETERKHSPTEASIVRAILALDGNARPTPDQIAEKLT